MSKIFSLLLMICLDPAAEMGSPAPAGNPIRSIYRSSQSASAESLRQVVRSRAEWDAAWKQIAGDRRSPESISRIDFGKEMLLIAAMGERGTGGYAIEVVSWEVRGREIAVIVRETSPGSSCILAQVLTSPVHIVAIPRSGLPARFVELQETRDCN